MPVEGWGVGRAQRLREALATGWDQPTLSQTRLLSSILQSMPNAILVGDSTQPVYTGNLTLDMDQPRRWFNASTGYGTWVMHCQRRWAPGWAAPSKRKSVRRRSA